MNWLVVCFLVLAVSCASKNIKKDLAMDGGHPEIALLDNNHFNIEEIPDWWGVALNIPAQNPIVVSRSDQAFDETKITFRYFVRTHAAYITSKGPHLQFTSKKTGKSFWCTYFMIENPVTIEKDQSEKSKSPPVLDFYVEINESVTLSLAQIPLPRESDEYDVSLYYGPTSAPVKLELVVK